MNVLTMAKTSIALIASLLIACGGDDGTSHVTVDASGVIDAPSRPTCSVRAAGFNGLSLGAMTMPISYARGSTGWFRAPTSGTYSGRLIFSLTGGLPDSTASARDIFVLEILRPTGGFQANTAYTTDPDPNSSLPTARAYIVGDLDPSTGEFANLYWAGAGSTTFTVVSEAPDAAVTGKSSMFDFREVDDAGTVAMGCTTKIAELQFYLKNTESPTATGKGADDVLTAEQLDRVLAKVHERVGI